MNHRRIDCKNGLSIKLKRHLIRGFNYGKDLILLKRYSKSKVIEIGRKIKWWDALAIKYWLKEVSKNNIYNKMKTTISIQLQITYLLKNNSISNNYKIGLSYKYNWMICQVITIK